MSGIRNHFGAEKIVRPEVSRVGADMNVTPLIDILLVLLVIFMAALVVAIANINVWNRLNCATRQVTNAAARDAVLNREPVRA